MHSNTFFSIIITTYNREKIIRRAVDSCLAQNFNEFEVIVVDDASTDNTINILKKYNDRRFRFYKNKKNLGIGPSRNIAVSYTTGKWVITLDSDWELLPNALSTFYWYIKKFDNQGIGLFGARILWENGKVTPKDIPSFPLDYIERLKWIEKGNGSDSLHCRKKETLNKVKWYYNRRGGGEIFNHLDLTLIYKEYFINEILAKEYTDAQNSITRGFNTSSLMTILRNSNDILYIYECGLRRHGKNLLKYAPKTYYSVIYTIIEACLLSNKKKKAISYLFKTKFINKLFSLKCLLIFLPGVISSNILALLIVLKRRFINKYKY